MSEREGEVEKKDDGFLLRKSVDFKLDMIDTQQEALTKTMSRYEQRDNPLETLAENVIAKGVDMFLSINEAIVNAIPDKQRLQVQKAWQDLMLSF
ncbi:MAG: hypothetical protein ACFFCS_07680 [Candidatus Hodarchaeota archaeon]